MLFLSAFHGMTTLFSRCASDLNGQGELDFENALE
jgi:hypothetical protein